MLLSSFRCLLYFLKKYPTGTIFMLTSLFVAGLLEGIGILSLLPILSLTTGEVSESSTLHTMVSGILGVVGLKPTLGVLLGFLVCSMAAKAALSFVAILQVGYAVSGAATDFRRELINTLLGARWSHFTKLPIGTFANSLSFEATYAAETYWTLCQAIALAIQILAYTIAALLVSAPVVIGAVTVSGIMVLTLGRFVRMSRNAGQHQTTMMSQIVSRFADNLQGIKPLKAMGLEDRLIPLLDQDNRTLNNALRRFVLARGGLGNVQEPILVIFLAFGLYYALGHMAMSLATLMMLIFLFHRIVSRFSSLQVAYQNVVSTEAAFWSLKKTIDDARATPEIRSGIRPPCLEKAIEVQNVSKAYGAKTVLDSLDMTIPARGLTAIIGPSGAGKTTLVDIITGLVTPDSGQVLVDGVRLHDIDIKQWRESIGYVPQELFLFNDTLRMNLTLHDNISDQDLEDALRAAGAWDFIQSLPGGLDSMAGERGSAISGGQRQRIAIARALVRKPSLLILDEATSALDPATEKSLSKTIKELSAHTTVVAISHRPSLIDWADTVFTMEQTHGNGPDAEGESDIPENPTDA